MKETILKKTRTQTAKNYCSYVIMAFLFSLPLSTSISNILSILIVVFWLIDRNFKQKFTEIKQNKVALAVLAYALLHIIGLLWTEDMGQGLMILKKQWKLLLLPIFMNMANNKHTRYYIFSFFSAMTVSMGLSYLVWFNLINIKHATSQNPTPFISHIVYSPFLALAIYIALHEILFMNIDKVKKIILVFIAIAMTMNITITQGRTGYIAFFLLMALLTIQYFRKTPFKATIVSCLILATLFCAGYKLIPSFHSRIDSTIENISLFKATKKYSSVGERLTFLTNSLELTKNNILVGVGTGDYVSEYKKINDKNSPSYRATDNPHNQYLRVSSQFGLVGLIIFLAIFYNQIKYALTYKKSYSHLMIAFPIFYMVIFIGDSYLQTNTTTLLFSAFGGLLFKTPVDDR